MPCLLYDLFSNKFNTLLFCLPIFFVRNKTDKILQKASLRRLMKNHLFCPRSFVRYKWSFVRFAASVGAAFT